MALKFRPLNLPSGRFLFRIAFDLLFKKAGACFLGTDITSADDVEDVYFKLLIILG